MFRPLATILSCAVALALAGCSLNKSSDDAAREAEAAASTFQAGALGPARRHIMAALAIRDDVSDYWTLRAQIASALGRGQEAYDSYRTVVALDQVNVNALRALCQLGGQYADPNDLDRFADQLAALSPSDNLTVVAHGYAALMRGNVAGASRFAEQALAANARDPLALVLKSQVLRRQRKFEDAALLIRQAAATLGNSPAMLNALVDIYQQAHDRAGYTQALRDLVRIAPANADAALQLADVQYQDGNGNAARGTVAGIVRNSAGNTEVAARLLDLWLTQPDALTPDQMLSDSKGASLPMRAAFAQYANERGQPNVALTIVGGVRGAAFTPDTLDAKVALAHAMALKGDRAGATAIVRQVLGVDPAHPHGLILDAELAWARGDRSTAVSDARQVVSEDPVNATARILLARYLAATGEDTLSISALRDGMTADPGSVRIARELVRVLIDRHKGGEAADVLNDLAVAAPLDLRAQQMRVRLCPSTGSTLCQGPVKFPQI